MISCGIQEEVKPEFIEDLWVVAQKNYIQRNYREAKSKIEEILALDSRHELAQVYLRHILGMETRESSGTAAERIGARETQIPTELSISKQQTQLPAVLVHCRQCQRQAPAGVRYCPYCGSEMRVPPAATSPNAGPSLQPPPQTLQQSPPQNLPTRTPESTGSPPRKKGYAGIGIGIVALLLLLTTTYLWHNRSKAPMISTMATGLQQILGKSGMLQGLTAYYAEDDADSHKDSVASFHGKTQGDLQRLTWVKAGKIGGAFRFNSINSESDPRVMVKIPGLSLWKETSIAFWIRPESHPGKIWGDVFQHVFYLQEPADGDWGHRFGGITERRLFQISIGNGSGFRSFTESLGDTRFEVGVWIHVVVTWSITEGRIHLYTNGSLENEKTITSWGPISDKFWWGAGPFGSGTSGTLDEIGLWNRVLTPAEIVRLYNQGTGLAYPFSTIAQAK